MKTKLLLLFLLIAGVSLSVTAQVRQPPLRKQHSHKLEMRQGKITKGEAVFLHKKKHHMRKDLRLAKQNDGKIGPMERKHLKREMKQYKKERFIARHNRR